VTKDCSAYSNSQKLTWFEKKASRSCEEYDVYKVQAETHPNR